ncbi:MAG: rhodanese-like domain-containing protein [Nannocystaceae bacterium]
MLRAAARSLAWTSLAVCLACGDPEAMTTTDVGETAASTSDATTPGTSDTSDCDRAPCPCAAACTERGVILPVDELAPLVADALPGLRVLDLRDASAYEAGHVPGAVRFDPASLRTTVDDVPGQVVDPATFAAAMAAVGVAPGDTVVAVDDGEGLQPARVVWTLRYHGHATSHVLDGGWPAWSAAGLTEETGPNTPSPASYPPPAVVPALRVDAAWIADHLDDPKVRLVDARAPAEFDPGHIPGALSLPWDQTKAADGRFLAVDQLAALYQGVGALPSETVVAYCQTGTRASVTWLTLVAAGQADARLYDGSWAEWSADPELPKEP